MVKIKEFPLQTVLELACAAQRVNKTYQKDLEAVHTNGDIFDGTVMYYKYPNRQLMLFTLGEDHTQYNENYLKPQLLCTNLDDRELANDIQKYYRRLLFAAIQGDNEFQTEVNALLSKAETPINKFGFIACLPSVYKRDYARNQTEKLVKTLDNEYVGLIGEQIVDRDCEILNSQRSKNFDAWNIDAIIDNKMVSWFSQTDLKLGPCVVIKGKVKDHNKHWKYSNAVTRLNYVKAAQ